MSTILGPDGRPLPLAQTLAAIREPQTARVGHLLREFEDHPARGLTPARLASIMVSAEQGDLLAQVDLTDDMEERDAHLYAEAAKRRGAITSLEWDIKPPENASAAEVSLADQVQDWLGMLHASVCEVRGGMPVLLRAMTDAVLKGYSAQELVWHYESDGSGRKVLAPQATWQPQRWFTLSADRRRFLLRSREMTESTEHLPAVMGEELQPLAWLMHLHPARNGYLARMSLARVLFWPYLFKNYAVRDLAEFLEIYGLPLRVGKYPSGASDQEKRTLLQAVSAIGHNAAGIIPQSMMLEFQAAAAGTEVPFAAMWDRLDAAESKAILGQTLTASEGQHGTQALGNVHNDVRMDIREDDAACIAESFTRQIIQPLVLLNVPGADPARLPRLVFDTGEPEDLELYAEALPKLAAAGLRIPVRWTAQKLRIPEPEGDEPVLQAVAPPAAGGQGTEGADDPAAAPGKPGAKPAQAKAAGTKPPAARAALVASAGPAPDLIDELIDDELRRWQPLMAPLVEPLMAELERAIAAGESLQAFRDRLPQLVTAMDAQPLAGSLARAAFSSRLAGEAQLDLTPGD